MAIVERNLISTLEEAQTIVSNLENADWAEIIQSGSRNYKVVDGEPRLQGTDLFNFVVQTHEENVPSYDIVIDTYYDEDGDKILVFKDGREELWGLYPDVYWYREEE